MNEIKNNKETTKHAVVSSLALTIKTDIGVFR